MKKPLKVMSSTALVAAFAASTIVPTMAVAAENDIEKTYEIQSLLLIKDGKPYEIGKKLYNSSIAANINLEKIGYVVSDEKVYPIKSLNSALAVTNNDTKKAIQLLEEKNLSIDLEQIGKVEFDGKKPNYVWDEQPEDRLNETFFYNVA